jgi:hypothetical protein
LRFRFAAALLLAAFAWLLMPFWSGSTGFTSLINFGDKASPPVKSVAESPHYTYGDSWGYDGMHYAQIAVHPSLREPSLRDSLDNPPYRARRILMPWAAHVAGLGRPAWILQAFAMINIACWFVAAVLLWRWLPPTDWGNWLRWAGVLFCHGACMSVHLSLTDLPGMTLLLVALLCLEKGRRAAALGSLASAVLCKETSLLACTVLFDSGCKKPKGFVRSCLQCALVVAPFALWLAYLRWGVDLGEDSSARNFGWPFEGIVQRWCQIMPDLGNAAVLPSLRIGAVLTLLALTVQAGFFLLRWRPENLWWRLGLPFAVLALFIAQPVWEGYPGAASRVLLPMTLAFNILLPRGRRWFVLLLVGNLSIFSGLVQLRITPTEFVEVRHSEFGLAPAWMSASEGWYNDEETPKHHWRWTASEGRLTISNTVARPLRAFLRGRCSAFGPRTVSASAPNGVGLLSLSVSGAKPVPFRTEVFSIPPEGLQLRFASDHPALPAPPGDPRLLSFMIEDLELVILE